MVLLSIKNLALATLVLQNSFLVIFMRYSRTVDGPLYASSTAVASMEVVKLLSCLVMVSLDGNPVAMLRSEIVDKPFELMKVAVPSFLYTLQNNILYYALSHLDAATFQVGYQLKILATAIFSVIMLRRSLSRLQWLSLLLLTVGVSLAQLASQENAHSGSNTTSGFVAVLLASCLSGFAGVYFESILKGGSGASVWMRNVQMCLTSIPLAVLSAYFSGDRVSVIEHGFFYGYSWLVVFVILLQAVGGLVVAVVVKYADNILKGFAASFSIVTSCMLSYFFFNFKFTLLFVLGAALVNVSMYMYSFAAPTTTSSAIASTSKIKTFESNSSSNGFKDAAQKV